MTKKLKDVIELKQVKEILNDFFEATGFPIGIIQTDGEIVIKSRWQPICEKFHRENTDSLKNCHESDKMIYQHLNTESYVEYKCLNGLVDAAIPLLIDDEHVASLFFGQFFYDDDVPGEEYFINQAKQYGFDEKEYIKAYQLVPVFSHDQVKRVMGFCRSLVNMLVDMGQKNLKLKTAIDDQAENARKLILSEQRYKNLVETSIDPIFTMNRSGEYLFINQAAASQLGGKPENFIGRKMQEFFPEKIAKQQLSTIQKVIDKNNVIKVETKTLVKGEIRWYSMNIHPVEDDEGNVIFAQSVARDISGLKQIQESIEEQGKFLESIYTGTSAAIFVMDVAPDGKFVYKSLNPAHEKVSGLRSEDLIGKTPDDLDDVLSAEIIREIKAYYQSCLDCGESVSYEEMLPILGKNIWWLTTLTPLRDVSNRIFRIIGSSIDITELKKVQQELEYHRKNLEKMVDQQTQELQAANEKLREGEEKYRSIFESVTDAIFICNMKGEFVEVNQAATSIYGYSREELLKMSPADLVHPDYSEVLQDFFTTASAGRLFKGETIDIAKNGDRLNSSITGKSIIYKGSTHLMAVVHDLTDLRKAQSQVDNFFSNTLSLLCIAGTDGYFKKINPAWEKLLGYTTEEILATPFVDFSHPDDMEPTLREVEKLSEGAKMANFSNRYRCKDGSYKWLSWTSVPVGDVLYAAAIDITEMKESEKRLKEEKEFTETAVNSLPGVFYMLDSKASFVRWNRNFIKITGYTNEEMSKISAQSLFPKEEQEEIGRAIGKVFSEGESIVEGNIITKSGEYVPFYFTGYRIEIDGEIYLVGTGIDISELKVAEKKLQGIMSELERSNTDLENFAYVASHDLQEPLRKISSFTSLLEQRYKELLDERGLKYMHYITDGASRMQKLINGLLKVSRVSTRGKEFDKVDMKEVMHQVLDSLSMLIREKSGNIVVESLPEIFADENQMISLLQNLIGNALKFCKDRIPEIKVAVQERKQDWLFTIEDNGIGISPDLHDKIFIIFQRLHNRDEYPGTGIGLAVCKKIVERHGGNIWLESEPEIGTKFYFTISKKIGINN
ncbi:MAG: PAS domain S-box protein [Candidatus Stygibacter australis]|nr:PAS domain S-box protein [Candidatus Stygibacter australis]MDP8321113.1 PAS domain S-box protein [Candidatus Stygibacter australis]